jgi:cytochrome c oxidase assembly factor CtaG
MSEKSVSSVRNALPTDDAVRSRLSGMTFVLATMLVALSVCAPAAATVVLGAAPFEQIRLSFPGVDVAVTTAILTAVAAVSIMTSVGAMVHLLFLRSDNRRRARIVGHRFELHVLQVAAWFWLFSSAGLVLFTTLDRNGAPLEALEAPHAFAILFRLSYTPSAWLLSLVASLVVLFAAHFVNYWSGLLLPLWVTVISLLAPVVTGQVLVGPNHDFGGDSAIIGTIAAYVFFGTILVATFRIASGRFLDLIALRRMFFIGAIALPSILISESVVAAFKLAGSPASASLTGWLLMTSLGCVVFIAIATFCAWHLAKRAKLQAAQLAVLLVVTSILIFIWLGASVTMTRQPPPQYFVNTSVEQIFMGFNVTDPPTVLVLFTHWRPNLLFLAIAFAAVTVYLIAVRVLRSRGDNWPVGRTLAWILGWSVVIFVTSSGFGKYSAADFGIHMIVHMSLNMLAPGLLVLGGVVTLLLRATRSDKHKPAGLHDWITWVLGWRVAHLVYNPLVVFVAFIASYYGLYLTGVFGELMRFHWAHQAMNIHFLIVGYLYYSLIIGVDRPPRPLPHIGKLGYVLAAMPFHAFFGVILMTSDMLIAESFYRYLDIPWADLQAQQYLGGGVAWAGGEIPLLIVIVVLSVQWGRQDAKEAKRIDRHFDSGRDDEFDVYNAMLARLNARDARRAVPAPETQDEVQK